MEDGAVWIAISISFLPLLPVCLNWRLRVRTKQGFTSQQWKFPVHQKPANPLQSLSFPKGSSTQFEKLKYQRNMFCLENGVREQQSLVCWSRDFTSHILLSREHHLDVVSLHPEEWREALPGKI